MNLLATLFAMFIAWFAVMAILTPILLVACAALHRRLHPTLYK